MAMRDFGLGKKSLEQRVHDEARAVMEVMDRNRGVAMTMKPLLSKFSANVICSVIFGDRSDLSVCVRACVRACVCVCVYMCVCVQSDTCYSLLLHPDLFGSTTCYRMDYDDANFVELTKLVNRTASQPFVFAPVNFVSVMRFLPFSRRVSTC